MARYRYFRWGNSLIGLESTVIDLTEKKAKIIRHGGINKKELNSVMPLHDNKEKLKCSFLQDCLILIISLIPR